MKWSDIVKASRTKITMWGTYVHLPPSIPYRKVRKNNQGKRVTLQRGDNRTKDSNSMPTIQRLKSAGETKKRSGL